MLRFKCLPEIVSSLLKVRTKIFFASADLPQLGQVRSCLMIAPWDRTWVPDESWCWWVVARANNPLLRLQTQSAKSWRLPTEQWHL